MTEDFKWINGMCYWKDIAILYIKEYDKVSRLYYHDKLQSGIGVLFCDKVFPDFDKTNELIENIEKHLYKFCNEFIRYYDQKYNN